MKKYSYSEGISCSIRDYLVDDSWRFSFDNNSGLFKFGLNLKGKIKHINYIIDVKDDKQ